MADRNQTDSLPALAVGRNQEDYCAHCWQVRADSINEAVDYLKRNRLL